MHRSLLVLLASALLLVASASASDPPPPPSLSSSSAAPSYDGDRLRLPADYRQWVYLTSGFDMSYSAQASPDHHMFDNVFVNREAYQSFVRTGTWPDKTMLVLETRGASGKGSINRAGQFQDGDLMGLEIHVKDEARFPDRWAFFAYDDAKPAAMIPRSADCYACHASHAAVDTTFVQFYPTLLPIAASKKTFSDAYRKESGAQ
jgi:hypothetical protein